MAEQDKMPKWLGITGQQYSIIEAIIRLQKRGETPSPRAIVEDDAVFRKAPRMQKSNFFAQLTSLKGRGFVKKVGEASYAVDFDSIKRSLEAKEGQAEKEVDELKKVKSEAEKYLKQVSMGEKKPAVAFYDYNETYVKAADLIRTKKSCSLTGVFPRLLYAHSPCLMNTPEIRRYAQTLWERCLQKGELNVRYITTFDVDYLFYRLMSAYKSPRPAYEEAKIILDSIETTLEGNSHLELFYTESPFGIEMIIPYTEDPSNCFLMIRDEKKRGLGSVYIYSRELATKFKGLLDDECDRAIDMRGAEGKGIIKKLKHQLDKVYSSEFSKSRKRELMTA